MQYGHQNVEFYAHSKDVKNMLKTHQKRPDNNIFTMPKIGRAYDLLKTYPTILIPGHCPALLILVLYVF